MTFWWWCREIFPDNYHNLQSTLPPLVNQYNRLAERLLHITSDINQDVSPDQTWSEDGLRLTSGLGKKIGSRCNFLNILNNNVSITSIYISKWHMGTWVSSSSCWPSGNGHVNWHCHTDAFFMFFDSFDKKQGLPVEVVNDNYTNLKFHGDWKTVERGCLQPRQKDISKELAR